MQYDSCAKTTMPSQCLSRGAILLDEEGKGALHSRSNGIMMDEKNDQNSSVSHIVTYVVLSWAAYRALSNESSLLIIFHF